MKKINKIIVHSGVFHCDDVLTVAMATVINPSITVERAFKAPTTEEEGVIIADIGGGRYDHHQVDAKRRPSGEKYAACGLFFRDFWEQLFPTEESARQFEQDFIIPVELQDNNGREFSNPLSLAVSSFVPCWNDDKNMDTAFAEAVSMMVQIVKNEIHRASAKVEAEAKVLEAYHASDKKTLVMDSFVPWQDVIKNTSIKRCIYPAMRGGFNLQVVPGTTLPEGWLENKPQGCTFVHPGLFLAAFDSQEAALEAVKELEA